MNRRLNDFKNPGMDMRPRIRYWMPAGAVITEDLDWEIDRLCKMGFGGIEAVSLDQPISLAASEDGWGSDNYFNAIEHMSKETKKRNMSLDLAIGPCWPIAFPTVENADHPAAMRELSYGVMDLTAGASYEGPLPERRTIRKEGTAKLIAVIAYALAGENILAKDSFINLTDHVEDGTISFTTPDDGRAYKLFAFYCQPAVHKVNAGMTYVVDHLNEAGAEAAASYWNGVFKKHKFDNLESFFCDSLEYQVAMEWTEDFECIFKEERGYDILPYLPFLGVANVYPQVDIPGFVLDDKSVSDMANNDYMEMLTVCYCEKHLAGFEKMAEDLGKTIRYQVAYNRPLEVERSGQYVAIPENEALGRAAMDGLKTMAAAAHLDRKKRYSFECAAEFQSSYGQKHEDLMWWVKRSLMSGMNAQVLHGAAYSGRLTDNGKDIPMTYPGFEGMLRVVSNNWNRTLSVDNMRGTCDTIARYNSFFRNTAKVDAAIYRSHYVNDGTGSEHFIYNDGGALSRAGYSYEFISPALFSHPNCKVEDGCLDKDGAAYRMLIVPEQEGMSYDSLFAIRKFASAGLRIIFIGNKPGHSFFLKDNTSEEKRNEWTALLDEVWEMPCVIHAENILGVVSEIKKNGIAPRIALDADRNYITACREDEAGSGFAVYAYNNVEFGNGAMHSKELLVSGIYKEGTTKSTYERPGLGSRRILPVSLEGVGKVYKLDASDGNAIPLNFTEKSGRMEGSISIEEDEMVLLYMQTDSAADDSTEELYYRDEYLPVEARIKFDSVEMESFDKDREDSVCFMQSGYSGVKKSYSIDELKPWWQMDDELVTFAGRGRYSGSLTVDGLNNRDRY